MQRYCAAVSTSSQRGSMIGPGATSLGSMAELPQVPRVLSGRGDRLPPSAGTDRIVRAALGISGSVDRQGLSAVANLKSARSSGLARGSLAADERVNCAGYSVPPRRSARDGASGENSMLTPAAHGVNASESRRCLATGGEGIEMR